MASIITEQFRKNTADLLLEDIGKTGNSYYAGIGKSDEWYEPLSLNINAPFPRGTVDDSRNLQYALTDLLKVDVSRSGYVIPRVRLTSSSYKEYNSYDPACFYPNGDTKPCYFVDDDSGNIYLFIYSSNGSISQTDITNNLPYIQNNEPYITFGTTHIAVRIGRTVILSSFNNEQFVEINVAVPSIPSEDISAAHRLFGFHIMDPGQYTLTSSGGAAVGTFNSTVNVYQKDQDSDALEVPVNITFVNGSITRIVPTTEYYDSLIVSDEYVNSHDFTDARVELTSISGVTSTSDAFIAPQICRNGFGYNIREYTPSWYLGFIINSRESEHSVYSGYRQVSLLKNPKTADGTSVLSGDTVNMKKSFMLTGFTTDVTGYQITQGSKRIGIVDSIDVETSTIYYNNSIRYGFDAPINSSPIVFIKPGETNVTSSVNPSSISTAPNFSYGSADVLFIDNRALIQRSADQNEELKIIIQL